jgi:beta-xylosidase
LATSVDLIHWTKYSHNPIFSVGTPEAWDNTNLWYGTVEIIDGRYWMWYEACNELRNKPGFISAVGAAVMDAPYFYIKPPEEHNQP